MGSASVPPTRSGDQDRLQSPFSVPTTAIPANTPIANADGQAIQYDSRVAQAAHVSEVPSGDTLTQVSADKWERLGRGFLGRQVDRKTQLTSDIEDQLSRQDSLDTDLGRDLLSDPDAASGQAGAEARTGDPVKGLLDDSNLVVAGSSKSKNATSLNELVERVVYYTLVVISVGVGFIAFGKLWQTRTVAKVDETNSDTELKVLNTIKLSSKVTLTLVGIGSEKIVVAADQVGVKSVIRLGDEGGSELDAFQSFEAVMSGADHPHDRPATPPKSKKPEPKPKPEPIPEPKAEPRADRYTLDMIGKVLSEANQSEGAEPKGAEPRRDRPAKIIRSSAPIANRTSSNTSSLPSSKDDDQAEVIAAMEAAMTESGLKDLILQSLKSKR